MKFVVRRANDPRPELLATVLSHATESDVSRLRHELHGRGCRAGLLFDERTCYVIVDQYESMGVDSLKVESTLSADRVLGSFDARFGNLERRVESWLHQMSADWRQAIDPDAVDVLEALLPDVVPALAGADFFFAFAEDAVHAP